jgi:APA family basic amino acid/polyamine antiporter
MQNTMTVLKLAGIAALIGSALFAPPYKGPVLAAPNFSEIGLSHVGAAMIACLLAYDGWNIVSYIAGEVKDPQKNFPRALALGLGVIVAAYVLMNVAILKVLPVSVLAQTERVGASVAERTIGPLGASLVTLTIIVSIIGSCNGGIFAAPRLYFAQAKDGLFFQSLAAIHPRFHTPYVAIVVQGVLGAVAALTGSYAMLITYAILSGWLFYIFTVAGLLVLRVKRPELPRPYRMLGYPVTPLLFLAVALWFVGNTIWTQPRSSAIGLLLVGAGVPIYFVWRKKGDTHLGDVLAQKS